MLILSASTPLLSAVYSVICLQMACELLRRRADLKSDVSVIFHLVRAGFGTASISKLRRAAAADAQKMQDRRGMH